MSDPRHSVRCVVKLDVGAVAKLLASTGKRRGYIRAMPTCTLAGVVYDYLTPKLEGDPEDVHSWEYGKGPRVEAAVPLTTGESVKVYAQAKRWGHEHILTSWLDDEEHTHSAWIPAASVRRLTASEWDIIEYHQTPPERRHIRWGNRLPGFLSE